MKHYKVKEGVERVNGKRVPPDRSVTLSDAQARYEFDQGKLETLNPTLPDKQSRKTEKKED